MEQRRIISTTNAPEPIGPYVQGIGWGDLIFTSGQIGLQADGTMAEDVVAQARVVLQNLSGVLEAGGGSLESVVKTTIYLTDMNDFGRVNEVYAEFFGRRPPARSTVEVAALPKGAAVEIEAIAVAVGRTA